MTRPSDLTGVPARDESFNDQLPTNDQRIATQLVLSTLALNERSQHEATERPRKSLSACKGGGERDRPSVSARICGKKPPQVAPAMQNTPGIARELLLPNTNKVHNEKGKI